MKLSSLAFTALLPLAAPAALGQTVLWHADGGSGSTFGKSIDNAGDANGDGLDDIVIGSASDHSGGIAAGMVQLRLTDGTVKWTVVGTSVSGPFGPTGDQLGSDVAGIGDVNGDGFSDVLVTATELNEVRVLSGADGTTIRTHTGAMDFGSALDGAGDVDGDGVPDYLIGNPTGLDTTGIDTGFVAMYSGASGTLLYKVYGDFGGTSGPFGITLPGDWFGIALCGGQDVNGDGINDFAVGAVNSDMSASNAGQVKVFNGVSGALLSVTAGFLSSDHYGESVSLIGDIDGDGMSEIAIGAPGSDIFGPGSGMVSVIFSSGILPYTSVGSPSAQDEFGTEVAAAGDLNGDSIPDFLVSAEGAFPDPGGDLGAVYMIDGSNGKTIGLVSGLIPGDHFGTSLAGGFDVNSDGITEFAASSEDSSLVGTHTGYVEMYRSDASLVISIGTGCGPGALPPELTLNQALFVGATSTATIDGLSPSLPGSLVLAPGAAAALPFSGCTIYTNFSSLASWIYVPAVADVFGVSTTSLTVPSNPGLVGATLTMQAVFFFTTFEFSNALLVTIG